MIDIEHLNLWILALIKQDGDKNFISLEAYAKRVLELLKMKNCEPIDNIIDY